MNIVHDITLSGYCANSDNLGPLTLGTYGSRDVEKLRISLGNGWDGMDVQVVFHPSGVAVMLPEDGLLTVPWEATSRALSCPDGAIVFQGFDGNGKLINTTDISYKVLNHSPAEGKEERPATPGIVEAVITQMKADREDILNASNQAKQSEVNAAESAKNAQQYSESAQESLETIRKTELTALKNAQTAINAASQAATSASSAKQSETNASNSASQAANSVEAANDILEQIKAEGPELTDSVFSAMLDGTNTTKIFWSWWPVSDVLEQTKYDRLCRFADMAAKAWSDKTYTLRSYRAEVSGESAMTPLDDLADKSPAQLCTETTEPIPDWADEDPMTWYIRANALSLSDGTMNVTFIEGEDGFDITGEIAPVYTFALSLWIKEWSDESYDYISFRTTEGDGFYIDAADVAPDNTRRPITWHSTFPGGLNSKGALTSGAGLKPYIFASSIIGIAAARKMTQYEGLWCDCDTRWLLRMWQLRHFNLENGNICDGCVLYNLQYPVAIAENGVKRILLTESQAKNLVIGSTVSIGDPAGNADHDRRQPYMRNISEAVEIESITDEIIDGTSYKAINLAIDNFIDVTATTWVSTWPYTSGNTEHLPSHKDGCTFSLTANKTPIRIAGVEVLDGSYSVGLDPLYKVVAGSKEKYFTYQIYSCKDSDKLSGNITADYEDTGIIVSDILQGWNWIKRFNRTQHGVLFPDLFGGSSSTYYKSAFAGTNSTGVRCPWRFADLSGGGNAGLAGEHGNLWPRSSCWYGRPRLSGAGKKRGK